MLVHIVIVPTADRSGPDLTRIGTLEDIPNDLARVMLDNGTARLPTDDEAAGWQASRGDTEATQGDGPQEMVKRRSPRTPDIAASSDTTD